MDYLTRAGLVGLVAVSSSLPQPSWALSLKGERMSGNAPSVANHRIELPYAILTSRDHIVGNIRFRISNYGSFGGDTNACSGSFGPAMEYPINSGVTYLNDGGLWVGAVRNGDTLVSQAVDGWSSQFEFLATRPLEKGIFERTTRSSIDRGSNTLCPKVHYSEDAISEQDIVVTYSDTVSTNPYVRLGGFDAHRPLGIEVTQESYAWSADYAGNFILVDYKIRNVGGDALQDMYVGIIMDQDIYGPAGTFNDDLASFVRTVPSRVGSGLQDTINLAWMADNDGDPQMGSFDYTSPSGVFGVRIVDAPANTTVSYNWWAPNGISTQGWGPVRQDTPVIWFPGDRTPMVDITQYAMMSNGEIDYPQWEASIDHSADGWLPPPQNYIGIPPFFAGGADTRYLLSVGPIDLLPDSTMPLVIAFVAARDFHTDPQNFANYFNPYRPEPWLDNLNFDNFTRNAQRAGWLYDNPGVDTDGDGFRGKYQMVDGDTVYYTGDGVPDYKGPPPPPPPSPITQITTRGKTRIRWNGHRTETSRDPFTFETDFEGYRVYLSRGTNLGDFAIMTSRDIIDFVHIKHRPGDGQWLPDQNPLTLDSLKTLYDALSLSQYGHEFHPDSFNVASTGEALTVIVQDPRDSARLDTNYYYFEPFELNHSVDDSALAYLVDSLQHDVVGEIRRVYPFSDPGDSVMFHSDGSVTEWPFYEYEYVLNSLYYSEPVYVSVTAFDFGQPSAHIASQETLPRDNVTEIWSYTSSAFVRSERPKPGVFPNPYRLADDYRSRALEEPYGLEGDPERTRRVTFTNVPDTCTISVYSLDGDLVRRLNHAETPGSARATVVEWNLLTRNTQRVTTGIYIYAIESTFGTDIGKLVIIK